jgi:arginine deiminase
MTVLIGRLFLVSAMWLLLGLGPFHAIARAEHQLTGSPLGPVGSAAEWYQAKHILMHTPGDELFLGVVHPAAALFERPFALDKAAAEHREYISTLEHRGVKVTTVVATLLAGTLDEHGNPIAGSPLRQLRDFAQDFLRFDTTRLNANEQAKQKAYLNEVIETLHPHELVGIILQQPTVHLRKTAINTGYAATYSVNPAMNLYFSRDQMITTAKGVVISKLNSPQRAIETKIIEFVLHKLGVVPIARIEGAGRLEGGDFMPAGDVVFIGQGLRTNAEGIRQLLAKNVFDSTRVLVVKDRWLNQTQMHLDTFFNIINPKLAVLVDTRITSGSTKPSDAMRLRVDVYERQTDGRYQKVLHEVDFQDYVTRNLNMKLIPVPKADQLHYGVNFLTVAADQVVAAEGVSQAYKDRLREAGVSVTWIDLRNMTGGYGAAHCMTQVLKREP